MKLDRNQNTDGRGKYALIHLRRATPQIGEFVITERSAVTFGNESPGDQFFVLKYKDKFTAPALRAYAKAVLYEADSLQLHADTYWDNADCADAVTERKLAEELREFAAEIEREAEAAGKVGKSIPYSLVDQRCELCGHHPSETWTNGCASCDPKSNQTV